MNRRYKDIIDRIPEGPRWFDEHAVPRYNDFSPSEIANIYASECCLLLIECQGCRREFKVAMSWDRMTDIDADMVPGTLELSRLIKNRGLHYGDPPNVDCCMAGPTMNSVPIRVLEFYKLERYTWVRCSELEIELPDLD